MFSETWEHANETNLVASGQKMKGRMGSSNKTPMNTKLVDL